jgi:hypothetical protein
MLDGIRLVEVGETSVFVDVPLTRVVGVAVVHAKRRLFRLLRRSPAVDVTFLIGKKA